MYVKNYFIQLSFLFNFFAPFQIPLSESSWKPTFENDDLKSNFAKHIAFMCLAANNGILDEAFRVKFNMDLLSK